MSTLNIGDVTFGVTAETDGMRRAQEVLNNFGRTVTKVAKSQEEGAARVAAALNKQERSARNAFVQTSAIQKEMRNLNAPSQLLARATSNFNSLNKAMTSGVLNVVDYTRANDRFRIQMDKLKNTLNNLQPPDKKFRNFSLVMRDLQSSAVLTLGPLSGVGARMSALASLSSRSTGSIVAFAAGMAAAGVGAYSLASGAITASMSMQKIMAAMEIAAGSSSAAGGEFEFVSRTARKLGIDIQSTAQEYAKFAVAAKGTTLEGDNMRNVFTSVATASRALNLSTADTEGIFRALTQMMSKSTVQAEELRGQLGDRLVGAFQLAARATGVTTVELGKLMKQGELITSEFLPKFADELMQIFGPSAEKMSGGLAASLVNMKNAMFQFSVALDEATGISAKFQSAVDSITSFIDTVTQNMPMVITAFYGLAGGVAAFGIAWAVVKFGTIVQGITAMIAGVRALSLSIVALNLAMSANLVGAFIALATVVGATTMAWYGYNKAIREAVIRQVASYKSTQQFITQQKEYQTATKSQTASILEQARANLLAARAEQIRIKAQYDGITVMDQLRNAMDINGVRKSNLEQRWIQQEKIATATIEQIKELDQLLKTAANPKEDLAGSGKDLKDKHVQRAEDILREVEERVQALNKGPNGMEDFEKWNERAQQLNKYKQALMSAGYSQDVINAKVKEFNDLLNKQEEAQEQYTQVTKKLTDAASGWFNQAADDLIGLRDGTVKVADFFNNMTNSIINDLMRLMLQARVVQPLTEVLGDFFNSVGGGFFGNIFKPLSTGTAGTGTSVAGRAWGGNMTAGTPYEVFDQQGARKNNMELFVPNSSGKMLSNVALGGGEVQIVINNNVGAQISTRRNNVNGQQQVQIDLNQAIADEISRPGSRAQSAVQRAAGRSNVGTR